jgi:hypothetical protein
MSCGRPLALSKVPSTAKCSKLSSGLTTGEASSCSSTARTAGPRSGLWTAGKARAVLLDSISCRLTDRAVNQQLDADIGGRQRHGQGATAFRAPSADIRRMWLFIKKDGPED